MTPFGSSSKKPPEKQAEAEKPAEPAKSSDEWGCSVGCLGFAFILYILAAIFILPHVDPAQKDVDSAADARAAIAKTFAQALPATDVKLKQLGGGKLGIWIVLMDSVGAEWYKTAGFIRFSTVTVRDEKSGKNLAIYHCLFGYSDLNPN